MTSNQIVKEINKPTSLLPRARDVQVNVKQRYREPSPSGHYAKHVDAFQQN